MSRCSSFTLRSVDFLCVHVSYCFDPETRNPYHHSGHAADVLSSVAHMCTAPAVGEGLQSSDAFALFVAAIVHDYRHPGVNQNFLVWPLRHTLS